MKKDEQTNLLALYREVNESFTHSAVFHLGIDAGFFAEFKYMIHAMLYCLQHKIRFCLYSRNANFSVERGWDDYFLPFCEEVTDTFHSRLNVHPLPPLSELQLRNPQINTAQLVAWKFKTVLRAGLCRIKSRITYGADTLSTFEIPDKPAEQYIIPEMNMDCSYVEAFRTMAGMIWHFNDTVRHEADNLIETLRLPAQYVGMQIRGGDKKSEVSLLSSDIFVNALREVPPTSHILLLTDDYNVLESVQNDFPTYTWHSLCTPAERGYVNADFSRVAGNAKRTQMVRFLAQMDALLHSNVFVGSITTGPSLFVLLMHYPHGIVVDCPPEMFPILASKSIKVRGEAAERYLNRH